MKILIDLNIKHKITMVMVTHDQALKAFSTKVVKMSDGKVLKITETDPETRRRTIKDLNDKCEAHQAGQSGNVVSIREGVYEASAKRDMESKNVVIPKNFNDLNGMATSKTSVRKARDYPVLNKRFQGK